MSLAVCATVKNEAADAPALVASLREQDLAADAIVIVDGGSSDGTVEALRQAAAGDPRVQVLQAPGANIAAGRNRAIRSTAAELVAVTDAGIQRSPRWLRSLVEAAEREPLAAGAFGYVLAAPTSTVEAAVGAVSLPLAHQIDAARYPPSSGSLLMRRAWLQRAGGYPEWLAHGEDLWLDRAVWRAGGWFRRAPGADVRIRPRATLRAFARQYFLYAAGDGHAGMLMGRHAVRYAAYALGLALLLSPSTAATAVGAVLAGAYLGQPLRRAPAMLACTPAADPRRTALLTPAARVVGDLAKMAGFIAGLNRRRQP